MKSRVNLTIEEKLLYKIKQYAAKNETSVSDLVETYFKKLVKPASQKNILNLVDELKPPASLVKKAGSKEAYFGERKEKYGF